MPRIQKGSAPPSAPGNGSVGSGLWSPGNSSLLRLFLLRRALQPMLWWQLIVSELDVVVITGAYPNG